MTIAGWFILVPGICYAAGCSVYVYQRNWPLVIVYSGYAWANVGLLWLDKIMASK